MNINKFFKNSLWKSAPHFLRIRISSPRFLPIRTREVKIHFLPRSLGEGKERLATVRSGGNDRSIAGNRSKASGAEAQQVLALHLSAGPGPSASNRRIPRRLLIPNNEPAGFEVRLGGGAARRLVEASLGEGAGPGQPPHLLILVG